MRDLQSLLLFPSSKAHEGVGIYPPIQREKIRGCLRVAEMREVESREEGVRYLTRSDPLIIASPYSASPAVSHQTPLEQLTGRIGERGRATRMEV